MTGRNTADWLEAFDRLEIPAGPVKSLEQVMDDPHLREVGFFRRMTHPTEGALVMPDVPVRYAASPAAIERLPPRLGEHGREILRRDRHFARTKSRRWPKSGGVVLPDAAPAARRA